MDLFEKEQRPLSFFFGLVEEKKNPLSRCSACPEYLIVTH
jgi:hypothetical protein